MGRACRPLCHLQVGFASREDEDRATRNVDHRCRSAPKATCHQPFASLSLASIAIRLAPFAIRVLVAGAKRRRSWGPRPFEIFDGNRDPAHSKRRGRRLWPAPAT